MYVGLIGLLRVTVDATSEAQRGIHRTVDYANDLYDQALAAANGGNSLRRLHLASMCLALYDTVSDAEGVSRPVIDRIAQCDVQRRRRRLRRIVDSLLVPNDDAAAASVSSMPTAS